MQSCRGRNTCLVDVTARDGTKTGDRMFISYCCNCYLGLPLEEFPDNRMQCRRCIDARNLILAQARSRRVGANVDPDDEMWATPEDALRLKPLDACTNGTCHAEDCNLPAMARGDTLVARLRLAQQARSDKGKLCAAHSKA